MYALSSSEDHGFQLRFGSLFNEGRGYVFPCDAGGSVNLDALTPRELSNYLYAHGRGPRVFPACRRGGDPLISNSPR